jgi:hypothetical protein
LILCTFELNGKFEEGQVEPVFVNTDTVYGAVGLTTKGKLRVLCLVFQTGCIDHGQFLEMWINDSDVEILDWSEEGHGSDLTNMTYALCSWATSIKLVNIPFLKVVMEESSEVEGRKCSKKSCGVIGPTK